MIHCDARYLEIVEALLTRHLPGIEVWVFGSRATGERLKRFSDLDLALITDEPLDAATLTKLKTAFEESSLPFKVDIVEWRSVDESFRSLIQRDHQLLSRGSVRSRREP